MAATPTWPDAVLGKDVSAEGASVVSPRRGILDVRGTGGITATVTDDGTGKATRLTIDGSGVSGGSGSALVDYKDSVRGAATANIANLGAASVSQDGITWVEGDRVFLPFQSSPAQCGVYVVGVVGGGVAPLTRATDYDEDADVTPMHVIPVEEGTLYGGRRFECTNTGTITLGTTSLTYRLLPLGWSDNLSLDAHTGGIDPIIDAADELLFDSSAQYIYGADASGLHYVAPYATGIAHSWELDADATLSFSRDFGLFLEYTTTATGNGVGVYLQGQEGGPTGDGGGFNWNGGASSASGATYAEGASLSAGGGEHGAGTHVGASITGTAGGLQGVGVNGTAGGLAWTTGAISDATGTTTAGSIVHDVLNANADTLGVHDFRFDGDSQFKVADGYIEHPGTAGATVAGTGQYRIDQSWALYGYTGAADVRLVYWSVGDGNLFKLGEAGIARTEVYGGAGTSGGMQVFGDATEVLRVHDGGFTFTDGSGTVLTGTSSLVTVSGGTIAVGGTVASAGAGRYESAVIVASARNATDTDDIELLQTNVYNDIIVGDTSGRNLVLLSGMAAIIPQSILAFGSTYASAGTIRSENGFLVYARNAGNTANLRILYASGTDNVLLGEGTNVVTTQVVAATSVTITAAGSTCTFDTGGFTLPASKTIDWASGTAVLSVGASAGISFTATTCGFNGASAVSAPTYTRNATVVEDRTLLASASATTTNNNNVLAALIADLQANGLLTGT